MGTQTCTPDGVFGMCMRPTGDGALGTDATDITPGGDTGPGPDAALDRDVTSDDAQERDTATPEDVATSVDARVDSSTPGPDVVVAMDVVAPGTDAATDAPRTDAGTPDGSVEIPVTAPRIETADGVRTGACIQWAPSTGSPVVDPPVAAFAGRAAGDLYATGAADGSGVWQLAGDRWARISPSEFHAPRARVTEMWLAPDDATLFVILGHNVSDEGLTIPRYELYRYAGGRWFRDLEVPMLSTAFNLVGRSSTDAYFIAGCILQRWDGAAWRAIPGPGCAPPLPSTTAMYWLGLAGADTMIAAGPFREAGITRTRYYRWDAGGPWTVIADPPNTVRNGWGPQLGPETSLAAGYFTEAIGRFIVTASGTVADGDASWGREVFGDYPRVMRVSETEFTRRNESGAWVTAATLPRPSSSTATLTGRGRWAGGRWAVTGGSRHTTLCDVGP